MSNFATHLKDAVGRHPDRPALRCGAAVWTFAQLDELSTRFAGGLRAHGMRPGDRVQLALPDVPAFAALYYGALRVGAVVVTTGPPGRDDGAGGGCGDHGARLAFVWSEAAAADAAPRTTVHVPVGAEFLSQLAFWPRHGDIAYRADEETAVVLCEREAAGPPTLVELTHGMLHMDASAAAAQRDPAPDGPRCSRSSGRAREFNAAVLAGACLSLTPSVPREAEAGSDGTDRKKRAGTSSAPPPGSS